MNDKKVEIIMSTYNGELYVREQLESLLNQSYKNIKIIIRDDGSSDNTLKILSKYEKNEKIEIHKCNNVGVVKSFFHLLSLTSKDVDYIAFCDQDDVWKPEKITRAIKLLENELGNEPLLYCSRQILVDENLKEIKKSPLWTKAFSLENALVENIATGCTCVINKAMKQRVTAVGTENIIMHDWLLYLVATAFGKVIFDSEPTMYYRQHSNNVVGTSTTRINKWIARIKRFKKNNGEKKLRLQAEKFEQSYPDLEKGQKEKILKFVNRKNIKDNFIFLLKNQYYRQSSEDNAIFKILIFFNVI